MTVVSAWEFSSLATLKNLDYARNFNNLAPLSRAWDMA